MSNQAITLLTLLFLGTTILPCSLQAQSQDNISFNPDTEKLYRYNIQMKTNGSNHLRLTRGGSHHFKLKNQLSFNKSDAGYQITETIDEFALLRENTLLFDLSTPFPEESKPQRFQDFLKNIMITTQLSKKGKFFSSPDYSYFRESNFLKRGVQLELQKLFRMFSPQFHPFYTDKKITKNVEFSRRTPAPSLLQKNDSTYYRTNYKVLQKTEDRTILSYQRMPKDIEKRQSKPNIQIKGMAVIENATGMLLHRRELLLGLDIMEYLMVINREDSQGFSLNDPSLDNFEYLPMEADTLDNDTITSLFSMQELPDSFESNAKARRYIDSLQPFLFYRKSLYGNTAQLLYKNIDNKKFIRAEVEWLKGFDTKDKIVFHSKFSKSELSFLIPQGSFDGTRRISDGQFIIPDTIDVLRGSIKFNMEVGMHSRALTRKDIGQKIRLTNSNLKLLSWNDSTNTISYVGLGGLKFYDNNGALMLPKKVISIRHFIPMMTTLLNKEAHKLTREDFFLYANIDGFPHYRHHYTLKFKKPVSQIKVLEAENVQPITRTFTIKKE